MSKPVVTKTKAKIPVLKYSLNREEMVHTYYGVGAAHKEDFEKDKEENPGLTMGLHYTQRLQIHFTKKMEDGTFFGFAVGILSNGRFCPVIASEDCLLVHNQVQQIVARVGKWSFKSWADANRWAHFYGFAFPDLIEEVKCKKEITASLS